VVVEGYTDSEAANRDASQQSAQAVKAYLVSRGVAADAIDVKAFGAARPIADNGTMAGRAKNRRVEIVVRPVEEK
jgi:outer membrane protein OmpA-like peptidoglycan-associated protein